MSSEYYSSAWSAWRDVPEGSESNSRDPGYEPRDFSELHAPSTNYVDDTAYHHRIQPQEYTDEAEDPYATRSLEYADEAAESLQDLQISKSRSVAFQDHSNGNTQDAASSFSIILYGKNNKKFTLIAIFDTAVVVNQVSRGCLKSLGLTGKMSEITLSWKTDSNGKKQKSLFIVIDKKERYVSFGWSSVHQNGPGEPISDVVPAQSPQPQPQNYSAIHVHLMRWKNEGNLVCAQEVEDLKQTFKDSFGLRASTFLIPNQNAQASTTKNIQAQVGNCKGGELLILYYAGHGALSRNSQELQLVQDPVGGQGLVSWTPLRQILSGSEGDVLLLLDCCHSGAGTRAVMPGTKILIAACTAGSLTNKPGPYSFTHALVETLQEMTWTTFSALAITQGISDKLDELRRTLPPSDTDTRPFIHTPVFQVFSGVAGDIRLDGY
ncbi:hypothetical protein EG329_001551 [Mollisiaceae sp. DMI_Dod_QoI]|nr:hypothetical protein EG329_001551 [Helotiales sp. DMI_Dod_QoI]